MTEHCPGCDVALQVPSGFRRGRCPKCRATLTNPEATKATRAYRRFHDAAPRRVRKLRIKLPESWWLMGHADAIEYAPPPNSERSGNVFRHEFGDTGHGLQRSRAELYASEDGRWLLVPMSNFKVSTDRGIVG